MTRHKLNTSHADTCHRRIEALRFILTLITVGYLLYCIYGSHQASETKTTAKVHRDSATNSDGRQRRRIEEKGQRDLCKKTAFRPEDPWAAYSKPVYPLPHKKESTSWKAIQKIQASGETVGLQHFKPIKPLGSGDTGMPGASLRLYRLRPWTRLSARVSNPRSLSRSLGVPLD
ncbi:Uncharacterized protein Rs2_02256 [Raphanus sativus]|nr:Uncharacterized protein Rs2_02256 [Raphanus sativus]